MKMTFRWYGQDDPVTLTYIKQIPNVTGVVSAIYDIPVGEVWPLERIQELKEVVNQAGLELEVIEDVYKRHGLYGLYQKEGAAFSKTYENFLSLTGKMSIEEVGQSVGIDLTSADFWQNSIDMIQEDIDSVSYTHLDVYKRQLIINIFLPHWCSCKDI